MSENIPTTMQAIEIAEAGGPEVLRISDFPVPKPGDGEVLMNLQDTAATVPSLTGVCETEDTLWLTSLFGNRLARLEKADLRN